MVNVKKIQAYSVVAAIVLLLVSALGGCGYLFLTMTARG